MNRDFCRMKYYSFLIFFLKSLDIELMFCYHIYTSKEQMFIERVAAIMIRPR